jgi:hypothetical protein
VTAGSADTDDRLDGIDVWTSLGGERPLTCADGRGGACFAARLISRARERQGSSSVSRETLELSLGVHEQLSRRATDRLWVGPHGDDGYRSDGVRGPKRSRPSRGEAFVGWRGPRGKEPARGSRSAVEPSTVSPAAAEGRTPPGPGPARRLLRALTAFGLRAVHRAGPAVEGRDSRNEGERVQGGERVAASGRVATRRTRLVASDFAAGAGPGGCVGRQAEADGGPQGFQTGVERGGTVSAEKLAACPAAALPAAAPGVGVCSG